MTNEEVLHVAVKLYEWKPKTGGWFIKGYKCPYCGHHYHTLRKELYSHIKNCDGPKETRSLED